MWSTSTIVLPHMVFKFMLPEPERESDYWFGMVQYLSNGRFKNADHQAVVNSNHSRLSIATFQNPAPEATVYPLKIREGEKAVLEGPITFAEMYRRKMSKDLELARLKKLAKEQQLQDVEKAKLESKPIDQILA